MDCVAAIPLGFWRFARACPSTNLGANSSSYLQVILITPSMT
jgi:hypothetical protein